MKHTCFFTLQTKFRFHCFSYSRHFLTCCSRLLGLEYHSMRGGLVQLNFRGHHVHIRSSHGLRAAPPRSSPCTFSPPFVWLYALRVSLLPARVGARTRGLPLRISLTGSRFP
jgi:hypothetical protein